MQREAGRDVVQQPPSCAPVTLESAGTSPRTCIRSAERTGCAVGARKCRGGRHGAGERPLPSCCNFSSRGPRDPSLVDQLVVTSSQEVRASRPVPLLRAGFLRRSSARTLVLARTLFIRRFARGRSVDRNEHPRAAHATPFPFHGDSNLGRQSRNPAEEPIGSWHARRRRTGGRPAPGDALAGRVEPAARKGVGRGGRPVRLRGVAAPPGRHGCVAGVQPSDRGGPDRGTRPVGRGDGAAHHRPARAGFAQRRRGWIRSGRSRCRACPRSSWSSSLGRICTAPGRWCRSG